MTQFVVRFAKRFVVLLPGIFIAWFSIRDVFPFIDRRLRLPDGLAILLTYAIGAYVLAPALIRLFRIIWPPNHLPLYCVTPDGFASDPVNVGVVATRRELIRAMEDAGWYQADPHTFKNVTRQVLSFMFDWPYKRAPVSSLYLFGRKQDLAFEIPISGVAGGRHHVRFWATTFSEGENLTVRSIHWHNRNRHVFGDNLLWVGAASRDIGIAPIRHNMQLTHMIHPDTNQERDLIVSRLKDVGLVAGTHDVKLDDPYRLVNRALRGYLHTDGVMTVVNLKSGSKKAGKKP